MSASGWTDKISQRIGPHIILLAFTVLAIIPVVLILMNSLKARKAIFGAPYLPPMPGTFSLIGYNTVIERSNFQWYVANSLTVTLGSMLLILFTGAMAAYALSEYRFPGNTLLGLYLALGIMIPIPPGNRQYLAPSGGHGTDQYP